MNLNFVPATRRPFSMEVSFLDSIQEIKQQIQEHHQIPAQKQTLIFNNRILQDDHIMYIDYPEIIENSHIQLIIPENQDSTPPPPPSATTATPSTTSWVFGSSTENSEFSDLWLLKRPRDNSPPPLPPPPPPEIPTTATAKFYQESSLPPGMANPNTTFSDLGISLENTNQFPPWLQDMDLFDNSLNTAPPAMAPAPAMANPSKKITLFLNMPAIGFTRMAMEFEVNDSIRTLKEKIVNQVDQRIPVGKLVLRTDGVELYDQYTLLELCLFHHSEIDISFKRSAPPPPPPPPLPLPTGFLNATTNITNNNRKISKVPKFPSSSSNPPKMDKNNGKNKNVMKPNIPKNPKKLKIMVLPFHGKKMVAVQVNANDNVKELRKELDKVNEREPLNLSKEGFLFIHKQSVMDEDQSFEVHNVRQGDTIEIFNGRVTKAPQYLLSSK